MQINIKAEILSAELIKEIKSIPDALSRQACIFAVLCQMKIEFGQDLEEPLVSFLKEDFTGVEGIL